MDSSKLKVPSALPSSGKLVTVRIGTFFEPEYRSLMTGIFESWKSIVSLVAEQVMTSPPQKYLAF